MPAALLVNGVTIMEECWLKVVFYHVELDRHAVLFAENAPAESYLDTGIRSKLGIAPSPTTIPARNKILVLKW